MALDQIALWIVGIIGASAWIPQLINMFKVPIITVLPGDMCKVGFTELGPVFNLRVAITADNKSVLIDNIKCTIKHEAGASYLFQWHEVEEEKGQMILPGIKSESIHQVSEAIAIKILPIDFRNIYLLNRLRDHTIAKRAFDNEFADRVRGLIRRNDYAPEQYYKSDFIQEKIKYFQSQQIWQKGTYRVLILIETRNNAKVNVPELSFTLNEDDALSLQENANEYIPKYIENECFAPLGNIKYDKLDWQWRFKTLHHE